MTPKKVWLIILLYSILTFQATWQQSSGHDYSGDYDESGGEEGEEEEDYEDDTYYSGDYNYTYDEIYDRYYDDDSQEEILDYYPKMISRSQRIVVNQGESIHLPCEANVGNPVIRKSLPER